MKDQTKVIAALLIGAAAGAALGLLLAPEKGETVRDGIADYINDLISAAKSKAQSTSHDLKEFGSHAYDRAKSKISSVADDLSDYKDNLVDEAKSSFKNAADEAGSDLNGAKAKVKSKVN
jgi:gas vesicle protein